MSISDESAAKKSLEELQAELTAFCDQFSIKRFEPTDIVELLEDGEEVDWILEQLKHDNADLDEEAALQIMSGIRDLVAVSEEKEPEEIAAEEEAEAAEQEISQEDLSQAMAEIDFSKIDIEELAPVLEQMTGGKAIDPGMLNQVKAMMQGEQGKLMADFSLWCQEQGIEITEITDPQKLEEINAQWMQTPRPAFDGRTPAEVTKSAGMPAFRKPETYHRETPKIGRNDPCPCGSGKKYKKCCGRNL